MRYCTSCGNQLSGNEKFCTKCGAPAEMISGVAISPSAKSPHSHKLRNIIIACLAVLVICGGGALAANYAVNEVFVSSDRELKKVAAATGEIKSFSYNSSIEIDMDLIDDDDRENLDASIDIDGDWSVEDKIMYSNIKATADGDTEKIKMYFEYDDSNIDLYICEPDYDDWEKGRIKLSSINSSLEDSSDYSWLTEEVIQTGSIDKTEINGVKAFAIDMGIDISALKENIEQKLADMWTSMAEAYAYEMDVTTDEVSALFENIQTVNAKIYIDRKTDLPIRFEMDLKDGLNSFMGNMVDLAGEHGEDNIGFETKKSSIVIDFKNYNCVDVSIPDEAYDGYDNGIINK